MRHVYVIVAALAFAACGPSAQKGGGGDDGSGGTDAGSSQPLPHTLSGLAIDPANALVQIGVNATAQQAFTVMAQYADGTSEDVTAQATWTVANPAVGTFTTPPTLDIPAFPMAAAVSSKVTASFDGVDGLAQITVVATRPEDFFFILPYADPMGNATKPLDFSTTVPSLDVFLLMDTTGSMLGEINNLRGALTSTVIPGIKAAATDSKFGIGAMEDFPVAPWGSTNPRNDCGSTTTSSTTPDQPLVLLQTMTDDNTLLTNAVNALAPGNKTLGCGYDEPEGDVEAIYQLATHAGNSLAGTPLNIPATPAGFRSTSMPVIVDITDAKFHNGINTVGTCDIYQSNPPETVAYSGAVATVAHSTQQAYDAVKGMCGRVVGVSANQASGAACNADIDLNGFANATGARVPPVAWDAAVGGRPANCAAGTCCTGTNNAGVAPAADGMCPLVFSAAANGTGVSSGIVTGIQMLARFGTFDVDSMTAGVATDNVGNPLPPMHTTADFIKAITPVSFMLPATPAGLPTPTFDATSFHTVTPSTVVSFNVSAFNDFVMQTDQAQFFTATISVLAGGCTPLDKRDVIILVPPTPIVIN